MRYGGPYFDSAGFVSVWVGVFPSEQERERQLGERYGEEFEDQPLAEWMGEFGFGWFDHDLMETIRDGLSLRPVRELLARCSHAGSFGEQAAAEAERQGIRETQSVLLLYDFRYDPAATGIVRGRFLRLLGAFPYAAEDPE